uniref:Uncharacterized protein n=1 Tax=Ciona savignyi TaxID=51511 RepID=H2YD49_CIOSA
MPSKLQQTWSPQQLLHMLSNTQARDKDGWKQTPLVASSTKDIGPQDRDSIVIWLSQVNSQFNFHPETYFLA